MPVRVRQPAPHEFTRLFGKKCRFFIIFDLPCKIKAAFTAVVIAARIDLSRKYQRQSQATVQRFFQEPLTVLIPKTEVRAMNVKFAGEL